MPQEKDQNKLTKEQIDAVALLSIGAFLEHFDRLLYVHTAILLNELFFPQTDPLVKSFIPAFAFCSSYFLTPLGSLFFGYIGDTFGRSSAIRISSFLMAACSITVALLPTYSQIGISATIILTICRMLQGISGTSEITGVELYLTESIKPPIQYPIVALVGVLQKFGGTFSLLTVAFFTNSKFLPKILATEGWRIAFFIGTLIGLVGIMARRGLKEASEFADRQKLLKEQSKETVGLNKRAQPNPVPFSTSIAYFFAYCSRPLSFYFVFLHCPEILKNTFNMSATQVINNNLLPTTFNTVSAISVALLSYKISPLKILKAKSLVFLICITFFPLFTNIWHTPTTILIFQCILAIFRIEYPPAAPIFMKHFPILKRFRYASLIRTIATTFTYVITSFSLVTLTKRFGNNGVLLIILPFAVCFAWSLSHFEQKEKKNQ